ncbi:hypothetical protein CIB84_009859, partial [Bambusicola thoracicus]
CSHGDPCDKTEKTTDAYGPKVNGNSIIGPSHANTENNIHHTKGQMSLTGSGDAPSLGFAAPISDVSKHSDKSGKNIILYYFILEAEVPDDEYYDEDDHNDVVQYLLDVVDEEAQNLLNRNNATSEAQSLLHIKKATSEDHLPVEINGKLAEDKSEDTDCDGSSLPEDFSEPVHINGCEDHGEEGAMPERSPPQPPSSQADEDEITWGSDELPIESISQEHDTTRVPLGSEGGYINASFIRMPVGNEEFVYIACQGPLPTTVADFWQMVWEQNCTVIAMMTQEVEGEKIKCQRYWPDVLHKTTMITDRLRLALVRFQQLKGFIIRVLELEEIQTNFMEQISLRRLKIWELLCRLLLLLPMCNIFVPAVVVKPQTGEVRHISHLNFTAWPDHDTPSQPDDLLTFISYMRHVHRSGPIVTHCSAGIGRSGTLICIDVVLGLISRDLDFDISDLVRTMRLQRHGMVQTE